MWVRPKALAIRIRLLLRLVQRRPADGVAHVHPCHTGSHLVRAGVSAAASDVPYGAAIAVERRRTQLSAPSETQGCEALLAGVAEWLPLLWRVDLGQPHLVRSRLLRPRPVNVWIRASGGQCVTVADANDGAEEKGWKHQWMVVVESSRASHGERR
jgi:hypothetical protein